MSKLIPQINSPFNSSALNSLELMRLKVNDLLQKLDGEQFYEYGDNLFDKNAVTSGVLRAGDGTVNTSDDRYVVSDFIPLKQGEHIQIKPTAGITVLYDANKNYIRSLGSSSYPYLPQSGEAFLRTTTNKLNADEKYVYYGTEENKPYQHYGMKWSDGIFDQEMFDKIQEGIDELGDVKLDLTTFVESIISGGIIPTYENLFDKDSVVSGALSASTGAVNENSSFVTSDLIEIIPSQFLQIKPTAGITVIYDKDKQRITNLSDNAYPYKIPSNAKYVRTSMNLSSVDGKYIYMGENDMAYKPYYGGNETAGLSKKSLKILIIGNSYSVDTFMHFYDICKSADINVTVGVLHESGGSLQDAMNTINGSGTFHSYYKWSKAGQNVRTASPTAEFAIKDEPWDVVYFQQMSTQSLDYSTFQPHLNNLKNYVKSKVTNPKVRYGINAIWSRATSNSGVGDKATQLQMWKVIAENNQQAMFDSNLELLIPTGTAIQNGRTNQYLVTAGDELTRDGSHLDEVIGRYVAAMAVFTTLYGDTAINDVTFIPDGANPYLLYLAKLFAQQAALNPYRITEL